MDLLILLCVVTLWQLRCYVVCVNVTEMSTNGTILMENERFDATQLNNDTSSIGVDDDSKQHTKKSIIESGLLLPPPSPSYVLPSLLHPPPVYAAHKYPGAYVPNIYTRVKLGYGTFYYNGRDAELRCTFPYNLKINSNFVWNKVTDNLVHYLDVYRVYERTYGHVSSLYIRDVQPKDFGIYACAVSGSFYPEHPVTFYQEVYFFPPVTYPG